jgi:hypothetical protein
MRWFIGGIIIGLLILELKILGGCAHSSQIAARLAAGGGPGTQPGRPDKTSDCGCGKLPAPSPLQVGPAQPKPTITAPGRFFVAGSVVQPAKVYPSNQPTLINSSFRVF